MNRNMIAVIAAMEQEAKSIFPKAEKSDLDGYPILKGNLTDGREYICIIAGVGPMNAAKGALEACKLSPEMILSIGVSGGLAPGVKAGEMIAGNKIHSGIPGIDPWTETEKDRSARERILPDSIKYSSGSLMGVAKPVMDTEEKQKLFADSGALAVDMESLAVAGIVSGHQTPFGVIRAVSDCSECSLPKVILKSLDESGNTRIAPILVAMLKKPSLLFRLIRLGKDYNKALKNLGKIFK